MKPTSKVLAGASLFALLFVAPMARGDGDVESVPAFSRLPEARLSSPPKTSPLHVGARERAPGIVVTKQERHKGPSTHRVVSIHGDRKTAGARNTTCVTQASPAMMKHVTPAERATWPFDSNSSVNAVSRSPDDASSGVTAVHLERVVETGATTASLEWTDAWVDPATGGSRLIAKGTSPLELVRASSLDLKVYAMRSNGNAETGASAHFVVFRSGPRSAIIEREGMNVVRQDGVSWAASGCGHLRINLAIKPGGDSATLAVPVTLRSSAAKEKPTARDEEADTAQDEEVEVRVREVQIQLSVSQTSRDPEPILSASFGWAGREQIRRVSRLDLEAQND